MTDRPIVVLDADVLLPAPLRDTILRLAEAGLISVRWSDAILAEVERNLPVSPERFAYLRAVLARQFPDALVDGYERHIPFLRNDAKDRHVVAVAVECGADWIVTRNVRDFTNLPSGMAAMAPAEFLVGLLARDSQLVLRVLTEQAAALRSPPQSLHELLNKLHALADTFVDEVRRLLAAESG